MMKKAYEAPEMDVLQLNMREDITDTIDNLSKMEGVEEWYPKEPA